MKAQESYRRVLWWQRWILSFINDNCQTTICFILIKICWQLSSKSHFIIWLLTRISWIALQRYLFFVGTSYCSNRSSDCKSCVWYLTVFSPPNRSSSFISENWISLGSERREMIRRVSPSALLMESVLSSEPSASKFSVLQAPQLILFVCFPSTGTRLQQLIFLYICMWKLQAGLGYDRKLNLTMDLKN